MEEKDIPELLKKYRLGQCTAEEKALLESWYNNQLANDTEPLPSINYSARHDELWRNISGQTKTSKLQWLSIAASIILCLGTALYLYEANYKSKKTDQLVKNEIKPGGNKAYLLLSNGHRITLTDAKNGMVATQSGASIKKTTNGQLVYTVADAKTDAPVEYNTVEAPVSGQWQVILPDGSHVWLNALSSLRFPTTFTGKERKVELIGEAYFEVAHNKARPFRVTSQGQTVEVLGTHFNIMAYGDEKVIKTTLLEGSVKISENNNVRLLKPGQQAQVSQANIQITNDVDLEDVVAWKNGYFKFDENLETIMSKIARWYNVEVVYQAKPDPNLAFGGKILRSKNLSAVLGIMELTGNVHFKIEGRRVVVMK